MTPLLVLVVVLVVVGATAFAYRHRPHTSIESGISSFRREMRALAPPPEADASRPRPSPRPTRRPDLTSSVDDYAPEHLRELDERGRRRRVRGPGTAEDDE